MEGEEINDDLDHSKSSVSDADNEIGEEYEFKLEKISSTSEDSKFNFPEEFDHEDVEFDYDNLDDIDKQPVIDVEFTRSHAEFTLALIKPLAMKFEQLIIKEIRNAGFFIMKKIKIQLTPELASDFYKEHYGKTWFPKFILKMTEAPVVALLLGKKNAIEDFKKLMGPKDVCRARLEFPKSLRALFGLMGDSSTNAIHGSASLEDAEREIHFFWPHIEPQPNRRVSSKIQYLKQYVNPILSQGLIELCKIKPSNPVLWLADWLLENNPDTPIVPFNITQASS